MTVTTGPPRAALLLLCALALAAPRLAPAQITDPNCPSLFPEDPEKGPKKCGDDCCMLACVEAEILKAKYQRGFYEQMSKRKKLTQEVYDAEQRRAMVVGERIRVAALGGMTPCNYMILPDIKKLCYADYKDLLSAKFLGQYDEEGRRTGLDYTVETDIRICALNSAQMKLIPWVSPCKEIGEAIKDHEQKHFDDCKARQEAGKPPLTDPALIAAGELAGYDKELEKLEASRRKIAEQCKTASCGDKDKKDPLFRSWEKNAEMLGYLIKELLADTPEKPPSKSPLAPPKKGKKP